MSNETRVEITSSLDIVNARQHGREMARRLGFDGSEATLITAAISEVARNLVEHAKGGEILLDTIQNGRRKGIQIVARDQGPGIPDIEQAMQYGFSTRRRAGTGLPGAKWLMDEFEIQSQVGKGTTVTMKKWASENGEARA